MTMEISASDYKLALYLAASAATNVTNSFFAGNTPFVFFVTKTALDRQKDDGYLDA